MTLMPSKKRMPPNWYRANWLRLILAILVCLLGISGDTAAQAPPKGSSSTDWRSERIALEDEFLADLKRIAQWCDANGKPELAQTTLSLFTDRDPRRQYIFLPSEKSMPILSTGGSQEWLDQINQASVDHGSRIFDLAKNAGDKNAGSYAYQLLNEVLFYDRDHLITRKILGHKRQKDGWNVAPDSLRFKSATRPHDFVQWPARSYVRVLTPHFEIESNAEEARIAYLAKELEQTYLIWRQVFYDYWGSSDAVKRWIDGSGTASRSRRRYRILFFKDRGSYLQQLEPLVPGIEVSTGYYDGKAEISFFYDGDKTAEDTWRHELTHQLFRESGRATNQKAFENQFIWLDEGIATYAESTAKNQHLFGEYYTLGGFDSRRIQYARFRRFLENYYIPSQELSALGRVELQQRNDLVRIYSESAGLAEFLMNSEHGALQPKLNQFLRIMYQGKVKPGRFQSAIGKTFLELDEQYVDFLKIQPSEIIRFLIRPELKTELSLPGVNLTLKDFEAIGKCVQLNWLDLSGSKLPSDCFLKLGACNQLNQLFLNGCQLEEGALNGISSLDSVNEIDFSGSSISNRDLPALSKATQLKSLNLTRTRVTDDGLKNLKNQLPNLIIIQ
jgi:hypothetical protein